ncbi:MAG: biotin--[acetyl-CoA-carboxylase] ligase [Legionellales bacterium]|nr:biotin--[acetyl-CoA-carboxylase] ligase [Legionellales bacterium]
MNNNIKAPISAKKIQDNLKKLTVNDFINNIEVFNSINSTCQYLIEQKQYQIQKMQVAIAERQTHGKGTHGKQWSSPPNTGIWLSFTWSLPINTQWSLASIAVGYATLQTLQQFCDNDQLQLKWPNDIVYNKSKLAGILINSHTDDKYAHLVIGIGINIYPYKHNIDAQHTALAELSDENPCRNKIIAQLLFNCYNILTQLQLGQTATIISNWQAHDALQDCRITLKTGQKITAGEYLGINNKGEIKILINDSLTELIQANIIKYEKK